MPFVWRVEPLQLLKDCGYSTYRLRKENIFAQSTVQKMRHKEPISLQEMDTFCTLTGKSIGKVLLHVKPEKNETA